MYTLSLYRLSLGVLALSSLAYGHGDDEIAHPYDLARRQLEANGRHAAVSKCARQITEYNSLRRMKRGLPVEKTKGSVKELSGAKYKIPDENQPTYKTIQNNTCIVAPEVTEGPYFVQNELLRNDLRENQRGVDLVLDIGVIDINTCEPLPQALVEIWSCNATGSYSSFTTAPPALAQPLPASTDELFTNSATRSAIIKSELENTTDNKTDEANTGRTIHIHTIVTTNWTYLTNGTVVSKSGNTRHIGQVFFDDELSDQVLATPAYQNSTQTRIENYRDAILSVQNSNGYNAFVDPVLLGKSIEDGVLAYITIGVDTRFEASIYTNNTWAPTNAVPGAHAHGPKATSANQRTPIAN
ncbi:hypothetical protein RSOLAG1IB_09815 [Rhizoctonia solani AG-1 IB]|uniref:Uncharacterized protein n=1 Tax=Thanatephorus cucumeris (strain AG1-IB / isolate 7/3/14) TaxID=1108050 RepID=A0A0B7FY60_THACB|nr:hypothetical protein RSOLAG1IB_09815 [Rhizoctonia solani AG-1 IB]